MKRALFAFVALVSLWPVLAAAQTVTVTSSNVSDLFGNKLVRGRACFQATNNSGVPISFRSGSGAQVTFQPGQSLCSAVTNGAFSVNLPDTSLTSPVNVCYHLTIKDLTTNQFVLGQNSPGRPSGYDCLQPAASNSWCTSGVCSFDNYQPNLTPLVVTQLGPPGPPHNPRGAWTATPSPSYSPGDEVSYTDGYLYVCYSGCASGILPTDTAHWMQEALDARALSNINNVIYAANFSDLPSALAALGGTGKVVLSCGPSGARKYYDVSAAMTISATGVTIEGDQRYCAVVRLNHTGDVFDVRAALFSLKNVEFDINTTSDRSGAAIVDATSLSASQGTISGIRVNGNTSSPNNGDFWRALDRAGGNWRFSDITFIGGTTWNSFINIDYYDGGSGSCSHGSTEGLDVNGVSSSAGWVKAFIHVDGFLDTMNVNHPDVEPNVNAGAPLVLFENNCVDSGKDTHVTDPRFAHFHHGGIDFAAAQGGSSLLKIVRGSDITFDHLVLGTLDGIALDVQTNAHSVSATDNKFHGCGLQCISDVHGQPGQSNYTNNIIYDPCYAAASACDAIYIKAGTAAQVVGNYAAYFNFAINANAQYFVHVGTGSYNVPVVVTGNKYNAATFAQNPPIIDESTGAFGAGGHSIFNNPQMANDCTGNCNLFGATGVAFSYTPINSYIGMYSGAPIWQGEGNSAIDYVPTTVGTPFWQMSIQNGFRYQWFDDKFRINGPSSYFDIVPPPSGHTCFVPPATNGSAGQLLAGSGDCVTPWTWTTASVAHLAINAFITADTAIYTASDYHTVAPITIERLFLNNRTAPSGCSTWGVISIYDGTSILASITQTGSASIDSGALSVAVPSGKDLAFRVTTAASGCGTAAANLNFTMQYTMQ